MHEWGPIFQYLLIFSDDMSSQYQCCVNEVEKSASFAIHYKIDIPEMNSLISNVTKTGVTTDKVLQHCLNEGFETDTYCKNGLNSLLVRLSTLFSF